VVIDVDSPARFVVQICSGRYLSEIHHGILTVLMSHNVVKTMPCLPFMTGNGFYIPPIKMVMTGGWCKWHCFTNITFTFIWDSHSHPSPCWRPRKPQTRHGPPQASEKPVMNLVTSKNFIVPWRKLRWWAGWVKLPMNLPYDWGKNDLVTSYDFGWWF